MKYLPALLAALVLATPATSAALHETNPFFRDYDLDRDGRVTRAEFARARAARFQATDANGDGWVSKDEYVAEYRARLEQQLAASGAADATKAEERRRQLAQAPVRFDVLDDNEDGRMTAGEFTASGARVFAEQDFDRNGVVTAGDGQPGAGT